MKIVYDIGKDAKTEAKRGFGFEYAAQVFTGETIVKPDTRFDYPEERFVALGMLDGRLLSVVFTGIDSNTRRIISARVASRKERRTWQTR